MPERRSVEDKTRYADSTFLAELLAVFRDIRKNPDQTAGLIDTPYRRVFIEGENKVFVETVRLYGDDPFEPRDQCLVSSSASNILNEQARLTLVYEVQQESLHFMRKEDGATRMEQNKDLKPEQEQFLWQQAKDVLHAEAEKLRNTALERCTTSSTTGRPARPPKPM